MRATPLNFESTRLPKDGSDDHIFPMSRTTHDYQPLPRIKTPLFGSAEVPAPTSASVSGSNTTTSHFVPLSSSTLKPLKWKEARMIMREVLNNYMESTPIEYNNDDQIIDADSNNPNRRSIVTNVLQFWFSNHLDCYFGSMLCSLALLILSIVLYLQELNNNNHKNGEPSEQSLASLKLYTSHITSSVILLAGSILSVWLLHRRRITTVRGAETKKRNVVASFLSVLDSVIDNHTEEISIPPSMENVGGGEGGEPIEISGTSLTDIYPVYRVSEDGDGAWLKLPSLLLVRGDFIALQLGDTAPGDCELVTGKIGLVVHSSSSSLKMMSSPNLKNVGGSGQNSASNSQHHQKGVYREPVIVRAGERVKPSQRMKFENKTNVQMCDNLFLPGKSKVAGNSRKLLHLSNHSKVFQILDTPIASFLQKKTAVKRVPQTQRKVNQVRIALYFFSLFVVIVSYIAISIRHSIQETILPVVLNLPLLAALGTLPITAPLILILLEIIGTSRILVTVHPFSSTGRQMDNKKVHLFLQYFVRGIESRLELANACARKVLESSLMDFPIANSFLYEKLGVVTALSLIDDELACDPVSTPQRLLIPTSNGLKLLDLFPKYEEDSDDESDDEVVGRKRARSIGSSHDSDSDWGDEPPDSHRIGNSKRMQAIIKFRQKFKKRNLLTKRFEPLKPTEVQFEDPNWWKFLPSLKCIGLASLLVDNKSGDMCSSQRKKQAQNTKGRFQTTDKYVPGTAEDSLITHVSQYYNRTHLRLLSKCIGFSTDPNPSGINGDIAPFEELRRIRIIATRMLHHRMKLDRHQISLEESRSWGLLRPDSTSVIIKDHRSRAYQLLTVGDAQVVTDICSESWQGESITPLSVKDRNMILENNNAWSLADLDVTAFSYAPIPYSYGEKFAVQHPGKEHQKSVNRPMTHLIDNRTSGKVPATLHKESGADDWSLIKNQIFLGLLGSCVSPRRDVASLIEDSTNAGVRFVYFSPRNMRRTKELASQMGIDVGWNCAISLRPLDEGEETDEHRMPSDYADWDVNARLPHGVEDVKRHLKDVDNVPLLVSLFTDVTRKSTCEMVNVFQEHHDTVLSLGLSHLSRNDDTFNSSDLSFGNDVLFDDMGQTNTGEESSVPIETRSSLHRKELLFISKIASHSCAFNLSLGQSGLINIGDIFAEGRAALTAGTSSGMFMVFAGTALTFTLFFCPLSISSAIPIVPASIIAMYVQVFIPIIALSMAFSKNDESAMTIVPPKNVQSITFAVGERARLIFHFVFRSIPPVGASHLIFLIAFGSLVLDFDTDIFEELCEADATTANWTDVIMCTNLRTYVGEASLSASLLMIAELSLCVFAQSTSFLYGNAPVIGTNPMEKNRIWVISSLCCVAILFTFLHFTLESGSLRALPWYFFLIAFICPLISVAFCEIVKKKDKRFEERAEKLRRLQFETRLGMWSPK